MTDDNLLPGSYSALVQTLRRLALHHRRVAAVLFALALLAKLLVPSGYMPAFEGKTLVVAKCNAAGPITISIPMTGSGHDEGGQKNSSDHPCAFSALGGQSLAAADPILLIEALVFAFVIALFALPLPLRRGDNPPRPPLRGPPALA